GPAQASQFSRIHAVEADPAVTDRFNQSSLLLLRFAAQKQIGAPQHFEIPNKSCSFRIACRAARHVHSDADVPYLLVFDSCLQIGVAEIVVGVAQDVHLYPPYRPQFYGSQGRLAIDLAFYFYLLRRTDCRSQNSKYMTARRNDPSVDLPAIQFCDGGCVGPVMPDGKLHRLQ